MRVLFRANGLACECYYGVSVPRVSSRACARRGRAGRGGAGRGGVGRGGAGRCGVGGAHKHLSCRKAKRRPAGQPACRLPFSCDLSGRSQQVNDEKITRALTVRAVISCEITAPGPFSFPVPKMYRSCRRALAGFTLKLRGPLGFYTWDDMLICWMSRLISNMKRLHMKKTANRLCPKDEIQVAPLKPS